MSAAAPERHTGALPRVRPHQRTDHRRAVGLMLLTVAFFATFDTLSKVANGFAPLTQTLWVRYAVQAVGMTIWWAIWLRPTQGLLVPLLLVPPPVLGLLEALMIICRSLLLLRTRSRPSRQCPQL